MIRICSVTKDYSSGNKTVTPVTDFSLDIHQGSLVILSGPSGSGKSTLLNMIAGFIKPTRGKVEIDGRNISKLPEQFSAQFRRDNIGMIFQQYHLIEDLSVADNIALPLLPSDISTGEIKERVKNLAVKLDIIDKLTVNAKELSGGEMQRTAIARAIVNSPSLVLADEPTANLDKKLSDDFINMICELKTAGKTIIIATHDPAITESGIADKVISMSKGS